MTNLKDLSLAAVNVTPVNIDWRERLGEDLEGYTVHEAEECGECGETIICHGYGEEQHMDHDHESECDGYLNSEGPMMNYYYELPHFAGNDMLPSGGDIELAAKALENHPLCLVEFDDGTVALALTGGGMDLTWEICGAFIALGYSPPLHFCDLPRMAGKAHDPRWRPVVAACMETVKNVRLRAEWRAADLTRLFDDLDAEAKEAAKEATA